MSLTMSSSVSLPTSPRSATTSACFKSKVVRKELELLSRSMQTNVAALMDAEGKRQQYVDRVQRVREFERLRRDGVVEQPWFQRQTRNRQRNESNWQEKVRERERYLDELKQRLDDKERRAREARKAREAERSAKILEAQAAEAARAAEIAHIQQNGPGQGVVVSTSQLSARARNHLLEEMAEKEKKLEHKRQQDLDSLAQFFEAKRQTFSNKYTGIRTRKVQLLAAAVTNNDASERALQVRLEQMRNDHEAKIESQRANNADKFAQMRQRAEGQAELELETFRMEGSSRAARAANHLEAQKAAEHAALERKAVERMARESKMQEQLRQQEKTDEGVRAELSARLAQQTALHERRKAEIEALASDSYMSSMRFARLKDAINEQQWKAQVSQGWAPEDGKRCLESLLVGTLASIDDTLADRADESPFAKVERLAGGSSYGN